MEKYYKKNYIKYSTKNIENLEFQIIEWNAVDEPTDNDNISEDSESEPSCKDLYTMRCFGVTAEGASVMCKITGFTPFYYIKVSDNFNKVKLSRFLDYIEESWQFKKKVDNGDRSVWVDYYKNCLLRDKCTIVLKKDLYGFRNGKKYKYIRLVFNNHIAMNKSKYIFKKPIRITGIHENVIKYKLYESNFEPFMRFCHINDILMAGWVKLPKDKFKYIKGEANTQISVEINWKSIKSLKEKQDIANFLQASWDIETYSFDGAFPDPNKKSYISTKDRDNTLTIEDIYPNVIYQIATTFKYYREKNMMVKHLLTLKKSDKIEIGNDNVDVIVEECKNEKELILRWFDIISKTDPDIFYTYNGDSFDCMYLYERAKLYGIDNILRQKLSRLTNIETNIKKETFSSSAYGDSEFIRFYIPGRLNYDLLIHYKRGMKKYPSYKLDYISNEILKEGKHDITAKEIFSYYKEGKSDQICQIGKYCIQDTELLQKLVDKQLILITIIQLANVTFVPIGFLTTRGQTIKVYSQLLRKARQMDFLVPHTNFNEDSYPINVKCKMPHDIEIVPGQTEYIEINCGKSQSFSGIPDKAKIRDFIITGRITEIIDDTEFVVLSDVELDREYYNVKWRQNGDITRIFSSDDLVDSSFTGATVLDPNPGFYSENIAVLDFASLYPTIMISRNLCYSSFIMNPKYLGIKDVNYENLKWDDKVEYKLKHTCEAIGKTGQSKNQVCGKQAFFEVSLRIEQEHLKQELEDLKNELSEMDDSAEIKKMKTKIKTKEKEFKLFEEMNSNADLDRARYFCRTHDCIKKTRSASEKFQKKDVTYDYTVVQPTVDENGKVLLDEKGNKINQGVLPALLEELYAERKRVKRQMAKASEEGNKLLEDILNSTQLAIKVSLNSTYGYLGRGQGNLILKELGSIVTSVGRKLIEQSKEYAEGPFIECIKNKKLLTQKIHKIDLNFSDQEKEIILKQFKI
jgi:DNA polymerase elongation subunit (family B)